MLNKKLNIAQLAVFAFIILAIQIVVSAFFILNYSNELKSNYAVSSVKNSEDVSYAAGIKLEAAVETALSLNLNAVTKNTEIPEGYEGIGYIGISTIDLNGAVYNISLKIGTEFKPSTINKTIRDGLIENVVENHRPTDIAKDAVFSADVPYEVYAALQKDNSTVLLLKKSSDLATSLNSFKDKTLFDNLFVLKKSTVTDIKIISGTQEGKNFFDLSDYDAVTAVSGEKHAYVGEELIIVQDIEGSTLSLVCVVNSSTISASVSKLLNTFVLIMGMFVFFSIATMIIGIVFYTFKYNKILFYAGKHKSNFVLSTDSHGNIKKSNETFRQSFKAKNIFDEVFDADITAAEKLGRGEPIIVKLTDKNELVRHLTLLPTQTFSGYKFVGGDSSEFVQKYITSHELNFTDTVTGITNEEVLINDYNTDLNIRQDFKTMLGYFTPVNLSEFQVMSGKYFADQILKVFGQKLTESFSEFGKIYYDGENFIVLTRNGEDTNMQDKIADIMQKLNRPMVVGTNLILLKVKAGLIILDKHTEDWSYPAVKNNAMSALKRAIKTHDTNYFVFHQLQAKHYVGFKSFDIPVSELIANDAVDVFYQPQLDLKTKVIVGFEALCRLKGGFMQDMNIQQFIEMVERRGEMIELGDFIYDKSLSFAKEIEPYGAKVSLNVSPIQMLQSGFADKILKKFNVHNLKPESVCIEVTETFLMTSFDDIVPKLEEVKRNGIEVHLDDFGVEHSSYLYLKKLPISVIKVDREFVKDLETDKYSKVIIESMVSIAKKLGLGCIAEGVENENQLKWLREVGCNAVQGFFVSQAISRDRALKMLIESLQNHEKSEGTDARK